VLGPTGEGRSTRLYLSGARLQAFVSRRLPVEEDERLRHAVVSHRMRSRPGGFPAPIVDGAIRQTIGSKMFSVKNILSRASGRLTLAERRRICRPVTAATTTVEQELLDLRDLWQRDLVPQLAPLLPFVEFVDPSEVTRRLREEPHPAIRLRDSLDREHLASYGLTTVAVGSEPCVDGLGASGRTVVGVNRPGMAH